MISEKIERILDQLKRKLSTQDIDDLKEVISKEMDDIRSHETARNVVAYYTVLIVAIMGNIFLSLVFIPFLVFLTEMFLYIVIAVLALMFGLLFNLLVRGIEGIKRKHYLIGEIFIPAIALINVFIMVNLANSIIEKFQVANATHSAVLVAIVYVFFFSLPYIIFEFLKERR